MQTVSACEWIVAGSYERWETVRNLLSTRIRVTMVAKTVEGKAEGLVEGKIAVARNLLSRGLLQKGKANVTLSS